MVFIGMLLGSAVNGYMSDRYGRRRMLSVALAINFLAGCGIGFPGPLQCTNDAVYTGTVSAFAPNIGVLIASRLFAGMGKGCTVQDL
jgi:MFS family permease